MLAAEYRLRRRDEFGAVVKAGRRAGRGNLVVHVLQIDQLPQPSSSVAGPVVGGAPRVGFVIPRAVGNAVTRNRVRRRLRHLMRERLAGMPAGTDVVVRASAGAAARSYEQLGKDLAAAIAAARSSTGRKPATPAARKARSSA